MDASIEFKKPKKGVIRVNKNQAIKLFISTSEDLDDFSFSYEREGSIQEISAESKGKYLVYHIPPSKRRSKYLTVYYRSQGLAVCKLQYN